MFHERDSLHGAGHALPDAREAEATRKKSIHGGLVRRIEDGWQCAARRSGATGEIERREEIGARSLKIESAHRREIKRGAGSGKASGIGQGVLDRERHVGRAHLGDNRSVDELHHRVDDALGMNHHVDLLHRNVKEPARLDHLESLVEEGGRVDGDLPAHRPGRVTQGLFGCH